MATKHWSNIELGEIADALAAYTRHPIRTIRAKMGERQREAEWLAGFNAEVDAYMAASPGTSRPWAESLVSFDRYNKAQVKMLEAMTRPFHTSRHVS